MIPLKIQLKNFISYGSLQTIDFQGYNLICLSGKNGHGKSALLDALTWALWGQARKVGGVAKADDGLLHLGQTHMMVILDFMCNGNSYRVRREYTSSAGKNYTSLDFGILDNSGSMRPLTDKTIRATQEKIETTIGLDYDTFINSAFLRQGQSHEFSKKTPKERKEILATILGLGKFELMKQQALAKAKEATVLKENSALVITQLQTLLEAKNSLENELLTIDAQEKEILKKEDYLQQTLHDIRRKQDQYAAQKAERDKLLFQSKMLSDNYAALSHQVRETFTQYREVRAQAQTLPRISYEAERTALQNELQQFQVTAAQKTEISSLYIAKKELFEKKVKANQEQYTNARNALTKTHHDLAVLLSAANQKSQDMLKKKEAHQELQKNLVLEIDTLERERASLGSLESDSIEKRFERRKSFYHVFTNKIQILATHLSDLENKKQLCGSATQTICPLCSQEVSNPQTLVMQFQEQQQRVHHQQNRLTKILNGLKTVLIEDKSLLEQIRKQKDLQKTLDVKLSELRKNYEKNLLLDKTLSDEERIHKDTLEKLHQQREQLAQEEKDLEARYQESTIEPQIVALKNELMELAISLEKIPSTAAREQVIHERLNYLSKEAAAQTLVLQEIARQEERKKTLRMYCAQASSLKSQIKELTLLPAYEDIETRKKELDLLEAHQSEQKNILAKQKEALMVKKGTITAQHAALCDKENTKKEEELKYKNYAQQAEHYSMLATALGKDGIQALLIEDALPEIEQEANALLSKLTDNQSHLSIESVRDLKSGKAKETLDIKISDSVGIRPYELFSGGEAFRIDFALRIALSKLLARRAGASLQTLIIDEGFGSQDEDGLNHIVNALTTIQEDFEKVIIVSHLPSLKEQFPIHFHIHKTAQGSVVSIQEHC